MAEDHCEHCGAPLAPEDGGVCPACEDAQLPATEPEEEVIDVQACPVEGSGPQPGPAIGGTRVRVFRYRTGDSFNPGCCCLGCVGAIGFIIYFLGLLFSLL